MTMLSRWSRYLSSRISVIPDYNSAEIELSSQVVSSCSGELRAVADLESKKGGGAK